jgi:hypothetical protein
MIDYREGQKLELRVQDRGGFDSFAIYLDGLLFTEVADQKPHSYPIARPSDVTAIVVHFGGNDGGTSAVVDVTDAAHPSSWSRRKDSSTATS